MCLIVNLFIPRAFEVGLVAHQKSPDAARVRNGKIEFGRIEGMLLAVNPVVCVSHSIALAVLGDGRIFLDKLTERTALRSLTFPQTKAPELSEGI